MAFPHVVRGIENLGSAIRVVFGPLPSLGAGPVRLIPKVAKTVGLMMQAGIKGRFQSGTDPSGKPWPSIKGRLRGGDKPLMDTGSLRNSITGRPLPDGAE